ncbi:hypothetical protein [Delftia sp. UME58]|uniref:hypothetical protein n=1 Tax=Delftia sp. UME58 TaxID=1862322 RepID=UPI0016011209|nr:hypothetical protein [Delftia sp. UME58]
MSAVAALAPVVAPVAQPSRQALIEAMTGERDGLGGAPCAAQAAQASRQTGAQTICP